MVAVLFFEEAFDGGRVNGQFAWRRHSYVMLGR